jgi:lipoyl(octanoyl) transferase
MIETLWLGTTDYEAVRELQLQRRESLWAGEGREVILATEHRSVITTGRRDPGLDAEKLTEQGIPLLHTERGGLATYHGPGQLLLYPIIDLRRRKLSVRSWVGGIEQTVIDWLLGFGVSSSRRCGYPGVWIGRDKVCAIGLNISRGVSIHGLALNIQTDLHAYSLFSPCGIEDAGVTRLADHGYSAGVRETAFSLARIFSLWLSEGK